MEILLQMSQFYLMKKQIDSLIGKVKQPKHKDVSSILLNPLLGPKEPLITPFFQNIHDIPEPQKLFVRHFCSKCRKSVHKITFITVQSEVFCVTCFADSEFQDLNTSQQYSVNSHLDFPIMEPFWPAEHQLLLLTGIEKNGFGNWQGTQEFMRYMGANYSIDQLEQHYDKFYGSSSNFEPVFCGSLAESKLKSPQLRASKSSLPKSIGKQKNTNTTEVFEHSKQNNPNFSCYNSKRGQFFVSYNQKLEKYIAEIEFRDLDSPEEFQIKMQILQCYNKGIQDREEKQNMIIQHSLLNLTYLKEREARITRDQYLTHASLLVNPLMKYTTSKEHEQLLSAVGFCLKIETMIKALQQNRNQSSLQRLQGPAFNLQEKERKLKNERIQGYEPRKRVHLSNNQQRSKEKLKSDRLSSIRANKEDFFSEINMGQREFASLLRDLNEQRLSEEGKEGKPSLDQRINSLKRKGIILKKLN